ncbi:MAG: D-alanyl-D-alanine carboxypeptidase [Actinobacteria bacterium]|nr:D-alanyl-D-alanine carboxypeptidase [Actinomycetota bacterium]
MTTDDLPGDAPAVPDTVVDPIADSGAPEATVEGADPVAETRDPATEGADPSEGSAGTSAPRTSDPAADASEGTAPEPARPEAAAPEAAAPEGDRPGAAAPEGTAPEPAGLFPEGTPATASTEPLTGELLAGQLFPPAPSAHATTGPEATTTTTRAAARASTSEATVTSPTPAAALTTAQPDDPRAALAWLAADSVGPTPHDDLPARSRALLDDAPRRSPFRPAVILPTLGVLAVAAAYGVTCAIWPLTAVQPTATAVSFQPAAAPAAAVNWPVDGSSAVAIDGIGTIASADQPVPMASITKLVTVLAALEKLPLRPGEQGPSFAFTQADSDDYLDYLAQDQSSLDVPVGGSLTEYQLLQGILLGSANNYADRLAREVWGTDDEYAAAANQWLRQHDLGAITVVTPSGFDFGNVATPRALIQLAQIAERNPVIAEIVKMKSVDLPGAGTVHNTNGLINDAGIIGIKTGTIGDGDQTKYNLLSAKDIDDDGTAVRIYVAALGQPSDEGRVGASRTLYADVEAALKAQPQTVEKGTTLGTVDTAWGATTQVVAEESGRVTLWNDASAVAVTKFSIGTKWTAGEKAGTLKLKGPLDATEVPLELRTTIEGPSLWWRLTHPLVLFGLTK